MFLLLQLNFIGLGENARTILHYLFKQLINLIQPNQFFISYPNTVGVLVTIALPGGHPPYQIPLKISCQMILKNLPKCAKTNSWSLKFSCAVYINMVCGNHVIWDYVLGQVQEVGNSLQPWPKETRSSRTVWGTTLTAFRPMKNWPGKYFFFLLYCYRFCKNNVVKTDAFYRHYCT